MGSRLALLLLLAACARTSLTASVVDRHGGNDEFAEMDFWDGISGTRAISNNDALHALLLSFTTTEADTHEARLAAARKRGWLAADGKVPANETTRVGWIARAVCIEAGIPGGLTMRVLGPRERWAVRELNYMKWLPNMSKGQAISGLQLIALLGFAEDSMEAK